MKSLHLLLAASAITASLASTSALATIFTLQDIQYSNQFSPTATSIVNANDTLSLELSLYEGYLSPGQEAGTVPPGNWFESYNSSQITLTNVNFALDWNGKLAVNVDGAGIRTPTEAVTFDSSCTSTGFFLGGECQGLFSGDGTWDTSAIYQPSDIEYDDLYGGYVGTTSGLLTVSFDSQTFDGGRWDFIFLELTYIEFCEDSPNDFQCVYGGAIADNFVDNYVPVPAAAWLFGSALVGLLGVRRK